jgi:phage tail-like protein
VIRSAADPYAAYPFRLLWEGVRVAGLADASLLRDGPGAADWRQGGAESVPRKLPGTAKVGPVTLERGFSDSQDFVDWARSGCHDDGSWESGTRCLLLDAFDGDRRHRLRYELDECRVLSFAGVPKIDGSESLFAIETIVIDCEAIRLVDVRG